MERFSKDGLRLTAVIAVAITPIVLVVSALLLQNELSKHLSMFFPLFMLLCSQGCFLGIVLPLVGKMPPWHLVAIVAAMVGTIYFIQLLDGPNAIAAASVIVFLLMQMLCACGPTFFMRTLGFRLTSDANDPRILIRQILLFKGAVADDDVDEKKQQFQFYLRTLFSWTSALAVLLSSYSVLAYSIRWQEIANLLGENMFMIVVSAVISSPFCLWRTARQQEK